MTQPPVESLASSDASSSFSLWKLYQNSSIMRVVAFSIVVYTLTYLLILLSRGTLIAPRLMMQTIYNYRHTLVKYDMIGICLAISAVAIFYVVGLFAARQSIIFGPYPSLRREFERIWYRFIWSPTHEHLDQNQNLPAAYSNECLHSIYQVFHENAELRRGRFYLFVMSELTHQHVASPRALQESLEYFGYEVADELEKLAELIETTGKTATALGLTGTILSLIMAFAPSVDQTAAVSNMAQQVLKGIPVAMVTSFMGLCAMVFALVLAAFLRQSATQLGRKAKHLLYLSPDEQEKITLRYRTTLDTNSSADKGIPPIKRLNQSALDAASTDDEEPIISLFDKKP